MRDETSHSQGAGERGFTLIEVLVALTILAVSLTVLFGIFGHALARNQESQSRMAARTLAASLLAQAESAPSLSVGAVTGRTAPDLAWRIDVRPYGTDEDLQAWPGQAAEISATVAWGARGPGQTLTLSTLRLLPKRPQT